MMKPVSNWVLLLLLAATFTSADETNHVYEEGESVRVYANKIGPFNNPLETYAYFELPGCRPASEDHKFPSLGQALAGDEHFEMAIRVQFGKNIESADICTFTPTGSDVARWKEMVDQQYWYQLVADDLPMWAVFGNSSAVSQPEGTGAAQPARQRSIFTKQVFHFGRNGNQIVMVNLTAEDPVEPQEGKPVTFRYSVSFSGVDIAFDHRFDRYLDDSFFEHRVHWFSIFNSFMIVLFLVGLVGAILTRTLRADYARYSEEQKLRDQHFGSGKEDWTDDSGWKQLAADVFRVPQFPALFAALIGTGAQLFLLSLLIILIAIFSVVHTAPSGSLLTYAVLSYFLTSFVAGYVSSSYLTYFASLGPNVAGYWMSCVLYTCTFLPLTILLTGFLLNFVAIAYDSAQAIPFGGMVAMVLLWGFVSCPLVVIGTVVARHARHTTPQRAAQANAVLPTRVNQIPRIIPPRPWWRARETLVIGGGILPFGSIFIELYLVFTSFWGYKLYYVYGFMLLVFVILSVVTACVSIVCTYFLVSSEDHRWSWTSFCLGASTAGYVFLYAVYFYWFKTKMTGFFMYSFYFTYMSLLSFGLAILCGTIAHAAAAVFIRRIYRNIKTD